MGNSDRGCPILAPGDTSSPSLTRTRAGPGGDQATWQRIGRAAALLYDGETVGTVAAALAVDRRTVARWRSTSEFRAAWAALLAFHDRILARERRPVRTPALAPARLDPDRIRRGVDVDWGDDDGEPGDLLG